MINLDRLIKIRGLKFKINRFWSSPKELPLRNVIGVVLNSPTFEDVKTLCDEVGVNTVRYAFNEMCSNHELKAGQIKYDEKFISDLERNE